MLDADRILPRQMIVLDSSQSEKQRERRERNSTRRHAMIRWFNIMILAKTCEKLRLARLARNARMREFARGEIVNLVRKIIEKKQKKFEQSILFINNTQTNSINATTVSDNQQQSVFACLATSTERTTMRPKVGTDYFTFE